MGHLPDWKGFFSTGYHNSFDLFLAVVTTIIQIPPIPSTAVYDWLTIFQLMRWYRVVIVVPRMRPLLVRKLSPEPELLLTSSRSWSLEVLLVC